MITLERHAAIEYAEAFGMTLNKYADPTEGARYGLSPEEARKVAAEDSRLIWLALEHAGWSVGDGTGTEGYRVEDYFPGGQYAGPDEHGIYPIMVWRDGVE